MKKSVLFTLFSLLLVACGGDDSSSGGTETTPREVQTIYDLGACTEERNGDTVFVASEAIDYLCYDRKWLGIKTPEPAEGASSSVVGNPLNNSSSSARASYIEVASQDKLVVCDSSAVDLRALVLADSSYFTCKAAGWVKDETYLGYEIVATREDLGACNAGNAKQRVLVKKDSVFFNCDSKIWVPETADGYVVKSASIMGAAQKGPFKFDSPLMLREVLLHDDALTYTGREYIDEISSNKGDFVIPKVNLVYPYAVLEVRGLWRNEVTGEWSKDSMTLRALTDLTSRTEVNINLLTHLEYDRVVQLVNKGYSVFAAKKQAEYEIMTAFGFATTIEYSENLKTFVASTSEDHESNATLMAIALLFIGDRNEAEIVSAINDFKRDIASDGTWNDEQTKADMADWAEGFDGGSIRANVKSWNILTIPDYENYLTIFWNNAYELGGCSSARFGVIVQNKNAKSKNYNVHYICKATSWQKATDYEKDTYQWADGEEGEFKKGDVTETYYVFEDGKWAVAKNESALGLCTEARSGEIGKVDETYYICKNKNWGKATALEYDTYQFGAGEDGEVRVGKVNKDKYYVYENGAWRASTNEIENNLGACVTSREGVVGKSGSTYYICKSKNWVTATALEYDTYGWAAGAEGDVKAGSVNANKYYVYENGAWRASAGEIENNLGACVTSREGVVGKSGSTYYICKSKNWVTATALEYDTYGWAAGTEGEVKPGSVNTDKYYVYENDAWRASANEIENNLGACVASRKGEVGKSGSIYYICKSGCWTTATTLEYDTYGWTSGVTGEVKKGNVTDTYYTYNGAKWVVAEIENAIGACTISNAGVVKEYNTTYYICKSSSWTTATVLEYDTYGKTCAADGSIINGEVVSANKYVCDNDSFRKAYESEILLNKGCVSYTEGEIITKPFTPSIDSIFSCISGMWDKSHKITYGILIDERDNKTYKTIIVGIQTWMAENLNYSDSSTYVGMKGRSWCYGNKIDSCTKYGRLYTWAAAMDSAGTWSTNGKDCGYGKACTITNPARGICPEGWHIPTSAEWETLYSAIGSSPYAMQARGFAEWPNATDAYAFSALPAGDIYYGISFGNIGYYAYFWSATVDDNGWFLNANSAYFANINDGSGFSVRCLKDSI